MGSASLKVIAKLALLWGLLVGLVFTLGFLCLTAVIFYLGWTNGDVLLLTFNQNGEKAIEQIVVPIGIVCSFFMVGVSGAKIIEELVDTLLSIGKTSGCEQ
jgi:hypothetical protein